MTDLYVITTDQPMLLPGPACKNITSDPHVITSQLTYICCSLDHVGVNNLATSWCLTFKQGHDNAQCTQQAPSGKISQQVDGGVRSLPLPSQQGQQTWAQKWISHYDCQKWSKWTAQKCIVWDFWLWLPKMIKMYCTKMHMHGFLTDCKKWSEFNAQKCVCWDFWLWLSKMIQTDWSTLYLAGTAEKAYWGNVQAVVAG